MRIFKTNWRMAVLAGLLVAGGGGGGLAVADQTPEGAYHQSVAAMRAHHFASAIPDLKFAADHGVFLAQYYLARLYAVDGQPFTDHAAAFARLRALVLANRSLDPYADKRTPFVASAERLLALLYRTGVPEAGIVADPAQARAHLEHAGVRLGDPEAQFQLAVMDLKSPDLAPRGLDTLDMLAESKHHAPAAAQIALVYSQGTLRERMPAEALAYAIFAVKLAGDEDRIWIGDIYQSMYCQANAAERVKAKIFALELERGSSEVTDGDRQAFEFSRDPSSGRGDLGLGEASARRECASGEAVPLPTERDAAALGGVEHDDGTRENQTAGLTPQVSSQVAPQMAPQLSPQTVPAASPQGFTSPVGYIGPPIGLGLKDLETPSASDEHGEPLSRDDDRPTQ